MGSSINDRDLINYITSPILTSIDDENQRLDFGQQQPKRPQPIKVTNPLLSSENSHSESIANFLAPEFSRLNTGSNDETFSHSAGLLSSGIPSRANTMSPSNSRFYDKNQHLLSATGGFSTPQQSQSQQQQQQQHDPFIPRPMSAIDFSATHRSFLGQDAPALQGSNSSANFGSQFSSSPFDLQSQQQKQQQLNTGTDSQFMRFPKTSTNFNTELFEFKLWLENLNSKQQLYVVDLITKTIDSENLKILKRKLDSSVVSSSSSFLDVPNQELLDQLRPKSADILSQKQDYVQGQQLYGYRSNQNPTMFSPLSDPNFLQRRAQEFSNLQQQPNRLQKHRSNNTISGGNNGTALSSPQQMPHVPQQQTPQQQQQSQQQQQHQQGIHNNPMNLYANTRPKSPMNYDDLNNQNILKLNALSTIQSRAKLDSSKRHSPNEERGRSNQPSAHGSSGNVGGMASIVGNNNKFKTSSVPAPLNRGLTGSGPGAVVGSTVNGSNNNRRSMTPVTATSAPIAHPQPNSTEANKILNDSLLKLASINNIKHQQAQGLSSPSSSAAASPQINPQAYSEMLPVAKSPMPKDISSLELLNNIPQWLKILRLHKYTDILSSLDWRVMVNLTDEELDKMGISTLGARRKLLKAFSTVKEAEENGEIH